MNDIIKHNIKETLQRLEEEKHIKILFAIESGSRGWGFPSLDSDYDCRFVYVRPIEKYLQLDAVTDYIELPVDETYDVNGWDLKKFLQHIRKSNPITWEWLQSPIFYREVEGVRKECIKLAHQYFDEKVGIYHYRSLVRKKLEEIQREEAGKLKHYFYALRSMMSVQYMTMYHTIPPMELRQLMKKVDLNESEKKEIQGLLKIKEKVGEKYTIPYNDILITYMKKQLELCEAYLNTISNRTMVSSDPLNRYFKDWVMSNE